MVQFAAFDPFSDALRRSSYRLGQRDQQSLIAISAELISFYEGNQLFYLNRHIENLFQNQKLRDTYKALAYFSNITSFIVDRVAILGRRKIELVWTKPGGTPYPEAEAAWKELANEELEHGGFDVFMATLGSYVELCKTAVAIPYWDNDEQRLCLNFYTPNVVDVANSVKNGDPTRPDAFRILKNAQHEIYQVWDMSSRESGASGVVYDVEGDKQSKQIGPSQPMVVIDPRTGRSLNPFVPFRTALPRHQYFVDDGQEQLLVGQQWLNRLWTQLAVLMHYGAFKMPILEGTGWGTKENPNPKITMDPSYAIQCPDPKSATHAAKIRWDGPSSEQMILAHLQVIQKAIETLVTTFHIAPDTVMSANDKASGVALFIGSAALKEKQELSITMHQPSVRKLIDNIRLVWNTYAPSIGKKPIPLDANVLVRIPAQPLMLDPKTETELDAIKVAERFVLLDDVVRKYNPDADDALVKKIIQQKADQQANPPKYNMFRTSASGGGVP